MIQIFKNPNYNFVGNRSKAYIFSGVLLFCSVLSIVLHGGFNLSIDFVGGTLIQLKFEKPILSDLGKIRSIIENLGLGAPEVKTVGDVDAHELQITVKKKAEGNLIGEEITSALKSKYPENSFEIRRDEKVGPKVSGELARDAVLAIVLSWVAMIIYLALRFQLPFGFGAVVALIHDVIIVLGVFSFFNVEISLTVIAALLTVVGFSVNDTIVVFDRIREKMGQNLQKISFEDRINLSVNETLSRTIITSGVTLLVVISLFAFFFNTGDALKYFSAALLIGFTIGTYSSIFVASPLLIIWNRKWPIKLHSRS